MRGILLDIEGTTTPITYVYDVLFPFARAHAAEYLAHADLSDLRREYEEDERAPHHPPDWAAGPIQYVHWLMDQDRKSTALKRIQGEIWLDGYRRGELHGEVFDDVPPALERWERNEIDVRIFSSGSVLAQKLLFSSTAAGDLTRFLKGYFDTTTGPKNVSSSYSQIAQSFDLTPSDIVFVSDIVRELDAARGAGMKTFLCVRPGNHPQPPHDHAVIRSFDEF
jgi:enolase-phosphatase E1